MKNTFDPQNRTLINCKGPLGDLLLGKWNKNALMKDDDFKVAFETTLNM